jgi:hypothetical protein
MICADVGGRLMIVFSCSLSRVLELKGVTRRQNLALSFDTEKHLVRRNI